MREISGKKQPNNKVTIPNIAVLVYISTHTGTVAGIRNVKFMASLIRNAVFGRQEQMVNNNQTQDQTHDQANTGLATNPQQRRQLLTSNSLPLDMQLLIVAGIVVLHSVPFVLAIFSGGELT